VPHRPAPVRRRPIRAACLLAIAILIAACGTISTTPPAATPADFPGITAELARRGVHVNHFVSGDAGCTDPVLTPTAIAFDARGLDQTENVRIYIYIFRNRDAFERLRASVDTCAAAFVTDPETFETAEESPFVLAGQGPWAPEFEAALRDALAEAAGTGG
jgi:hypothetical protein